MNIAILGFAREGRSTLKFLRRSPQYKNAEVWIVDKKATIKIPRGIHGQLGKSYLRNLSRFDLMFRSPGIPWNTPELVRARRAGVEFSSATQLFFEQLRGLTQTERGRTQTKQPGPTVIGITGTKGKGTTSTLLYQILSAKGGSAPGGKAENKVFLAGNIGRPALDLLPRLSALGPRSSAFVVLELSSFQLQNLRTSPHIAAILDVFPDHQDAHKNLREYYGAKTNIARYQKKNDVVFFLSAEGGSASGGKNNSMSKWVARHGNGKKIAVDPVKSNTLLHGVDLKIPGPHNFKNAAMAANVAKHLGISEHIILKVIKNYRGMEHRLELVRVIRAPHRITQKHTRKNTEMVRRRSASDIPRHSAIEFWNDSASTNPQTTAAAIRAFPDMQKILIAGGQDKGLTYTPLAQALKGSNTKLVVLFGENKKKIAHALRGIKNNELRIMETKNLPQAINAAYVFAKKSITHHSSFIILFSPGAASFDQFRDYADRGRIFKNLINQLT